MSPTNVRDTLPTLAHITQHLHDGIAKLETIVGIPMVVDEEAEETLTDALSLLRGTLPLVEWVAGQVGSSPVPVLPLDPVAAAFAPPLRHAMNTQVRLPPRKGDAFVDNMLNVAPSLKGLTFPIRRVMLDPESVVAVLLPTAKFEVGQYGPDDGTDPFEVTVVDTPAGEAPMVSYRLSGTTNIAASRIKSAAMVLLAHDTAPADLLPPRASMTLKAEAGAWCIVHMLLENAAEVVAAIPPCVLKGINGVPAWPIQMLTLVASGIYDEKRIAMAHVPKLSPAGLPTAGTTGIKVISFQEQMDELAKRQGKDLQRPLIGMGMGTPARPAGQTKDEALEQLVRGLEKAKREMQPPAVVDLYSEAIKRYGGVMAPVEYKGIFAPNSQRPEGPVTAGELLRRRQEQEKANDLSAARLKRMADPVLWAKPAKPDPEPQLTLLAAGQPVESMAEKTARKRADAATKQRADEERLAKVVFSYWQDVMGKHRSLFDVRRKTRIVTRLRENSGDVGELLYAIDGAEKDDWLMGRDPQSNGKKYNDIDTIFRDRGQVEKLAETIRGYQRDEEHPVVLVMTGKVEL